MRSSDVSICSICKMAVKVQLQSHAYLEASASHILKCMPSRVDCRQQKSMYMTCQQQSRAIWKEIVFPDPVSLSLLCQLSWPRSVHNPKVMAWVLTWSANPFGKSLVLSILLFTEPGLVTTSQCGAEEVIVCFRGVSWELTASALILLRSVSLKSRSFRVLRQGGALVGHGTPRPSQ